jgi:hypothetical protein
MTGSIPYGLMIFIWLAAAEAGAYTRDDCIRCHRDGSRESALHLSIEAFDGSVHGTELSCRDCHTGVTDDDHALRKGSGAVSCSNCHDQENGHGKRGAMDDRPRCASCHSKHDIRRKDDRESSVHFIRLQRTCNQCHLVESGMTGYLSWLPSVQIKSHGKQDAGRRYERNATGKRTAEVSCWAISMPGPIPKNNRQSLPLPSFISSPWWLWSSEGLASSIVHFPEN